MKLYFIRHGKTKGNEQRRYVGTTDEPLLPGEAEKIKAIWQPVFESDQIEAIYASPMKRCLETARVLRRNQEREIPVKEAAGLEECDFGLFEYKNYEELKNDPYYKEWIDSNGCLPFPLGESREEFKSRCVKAFQWAVFDAKSHCYENVAFVVHGGTIMAVLEEFARPLEDYFHWQIKNGQGWKGEYYDGESVSMSGGGYSGPYIWRPSLVMASGDGDREVY